MMIARASHAVLAAAGLVLLLALQACGEARPIVPPPPAPTTTASAPWANGLAERFGFAFERSVLRGRSTVFFGVHVERPGFVLAADELVLRGVAPSPTGLRAGTVELNGFVVTMGPSVTLSGRTLRLTDLRMAREGADEDLASALVRLSFARAEAAAMTADRTGAARLTVGTLSLASYEAGRLGFLGAHDVSFEPLGGKARREARAVQASLGGGAWSLSRAPGRVVARSVEWSGLDARPALLALASGLPVPAGGDEALRVGDLVLNGVSHHVATQTAQRADRVRATGFAFSGLFPVAFDVAAEGMRTDLSVYLAPEGEAARVFRARRLHAVQGHGRLRWAYDPASGRGELSAWSRGRGLYRAGARAVLAGVGPGGPGLASATLDGLTFSLADERLLDAVFELAAIGRRRSGEVVRRQAASVITLSAYHRSAVNPSLPTHASALSRFLSRGGRLTVTLSPDEPIPLASLTSRRGQAAGPLLDRVGLSVRQSD